MNEKQIEYLSLKPPLSNGDIEDSTNYQIWLRREELDIINNSDYPDYILKLNEKDRTKAASRARHKILYELMCKAEDDKDDDLLNWVHNMIVNETAGFVKYYLKRIECNQDIYLETVNQCFMAIIRDYKKIGAKLDNFTLSTLLTRMFMHEISAMNNIEKYRTTAGKASNARKVEFAIDFYKKHGNNNPTHLDLSLMTGLSDKVISDSLYVIRASSAVDAENELKTKVAEDFDPITYAIQSNVRELITQELQSCSAFERKCVIEKYDLLNEYGSKKSVALIARELKTTPNEVTKAVARALNKLKKSPALHALIFGTETVVKEISSDRKNITDYFDEAFELMPEFSDSTAKATTKKSRKKKEDNGPQEIKLPWN